MDLLSFVGTDYKSALTVFFNENENLQEKNYLLFRDMYMTTNDKGQWVQKEGMWKKSDENEVVPKNSTDIKSKK